MKKRVLTSLVAVFMTLGLFAGCGIEDSTESESVAVASNTDADVASTADADADADDAEDAALINVTIEVVDADGHTESYEVATDGEYLIDAMDDAGELGFTYAGEDSDYGIYLTTINGVTADYSVDASYWAIYVNGEYGMYGADSQPLAEGDVYSFTYTK